MAKLPNFCKNCKNLPANVLRNCGIYNDFAHVALHDQLFEKNAIFLHNAMEVYINTSKYVEKYQEQ